MTSRSIDWSAAGRKAWETRRARAQGILPTPTPKTMTTSRSEAARKAWATRRGQPPRRRRICRTYSYIAPAAHTIRADSARGLLAGWGLKITNLTKSVNVIFCHGDIRVPVNGRTLRDYLMAAPDASYTVHMPKARETKKEIFYFLPDKEKKTMVGHSGMLGSLTIETVLSQYGKSRITFSGDPSSSSGLIASARSTTIEVNI